MLYFFFYLGPLRISVFVTVGVTLDKYKYFLLLHECALKLTEFWNASLLFDLIINLLMGASILALAKSIYYFLLRIVLDQLICKIVQYSAINKTQSILFYSG